MLKRKNKLLIPKGTSSQLTLRRSIRSPTNEIRLPKKCLICSKVKFIHGTRTQNKLILCTDLHSDQTLKMASQQKTDKKMIATCSDELVAKEAYYQKTFYQSLTRDFLSNQIQSRGKEWMSLVLLKN